MAVSWHLLPNHGTPPPQKQGDCFSATMPPHPGEVPSAITRKLQHQLLFFGAEFQVSPNQAVSGPENVLGSASCGGEQRILPSFENELGIQVGNTD